MKEILKVLRSRRRPMTKTERLKIMLRNGNIKDAFAIAKSFRDGFSKQEKRTIEIAAESLKGNEEFYHQLGIDTESEVKKAETILRTKYKVSKS